MSDIGARIRARRKALGWTQQELADKLRISITSVNAWEVGRSKPWDHLVPLATALKETTDWLLTGKDVAPKEKPLTTADVAKSAELEYAELPRMHQLPVVATIAANHLPTFVETKEAEFVDIRYPRSNHYCLRVKGQSMRPMILEGDILIVEKVYYALPELLEEVGPADKTLWKSLSKKVVCASIDNDDPILKRILVSDSKSTGFRIRLRGDNPVSEDIEIQKENSLKVFGIVKQIMRDPSKYE
ncbi:MAG TPA: S24 family peptidase [Planctomycetota bacterium]